MVDSYTQIVLRVLAAWDPHNIELSELLVDIWRRSASTQTFRHDLQNVLDHVLFMGASRVSISDLGDSPETVTVAEFIRLVGGEPPSFLDTEDLIQNCEAALEPAEESSEPPAAQSQSEAPPDFEAPPAPELPVDHPSPAAEPQQGHLERELAQDHQPEQPRQRQQQQDPPTESEARAAEEVATGRPVEWYWHMNPVDNGDEPGGFSFSELATTDSPQAPAASAPHPSPPAPTEAPSREVVVSAQTLDGQVVQQFETARDYRLDFHVGKSDPGNLATGDRSITGVPVSGLQTHWVVSSADVQLSAVSADATARQIGQTWTAEFDILIPETGESPTVGLGIRPNSIPATLSVTIYATLSTGAQELYRELSVKLEGAPAASHDEIRKSPDQLNLRTPHEWATPPAHIQVVIVNGLAIVSSQKLAAKQYRFMEPFTALPATLAGSILNVRNSLEALREAHSDYLDDLDANDMAQRLAAGSWKPYAATETGWIPLPGSPDPKHDAAFATVQSSGEFQAFASDGYALFDACFALGTQFRALLEELPPGSRIDFMWNAQGGPSFISHVPWALMCMKPVDVTGAILPDPLDFLGLRFRIGSFSWPVSNASVVIGGLDSTYSLWLMYWGDKDGDEVAREAQWQATQFKSWTQLKFLPAATTAAANRKREIVVALDQPEPIPAGILYMYCHCTVGTGTDPCLRFGNTSRDEDILRRVDLSQKALKDAPLVFANACTTAQADPHMTSELEQRFFNRGIRAFIGTETKVPVVLASRGAWLFFHFLYRRADPEPLCAGEALTQTRMFLWTQYRNIGGLFYSITNQYDLYLASSEEVAALAQK